MPSLSKFSPAPWSPPRVVRVSGDEWVIAVTCCMVDFDRTVSVGHLAGQLGPLLLGHRRSRTKGHLHAYLDAPVEKAWWWATELDGDPQHALMSELRGWCGDRAGGAMPVEHCVSAQRRAWWAALVRAHQIGLQLKRRTK